MSYKEPHFIILIFFLSLTLLAKAQQKEIDKNSYENSYAPSTLKLINKTTDTITLANQGKTYTIPRIEIKRIKQEWSKKNDLSIKLEYEFPLVLQDIHEMGSLSNILGIKITNPKHLNLYREAAEWLGTRYRWAGSSKKGVDCSGLTSILVKKVYDKEIDRTSSIIANKVDEVLDKENLEPGDLVFFSTLRRKHITHVGVYLGDRHFIHASRKGVVVSSLDDSYYSATLRKAGRI